MAKPGKVLEADLERLVQKLINELDVVESELDRLPAEAEEVERSPAENALRQFREEYSKRVRAAHAN